MPFQTSRHQNNIKNNSRDGTKFVQSVILESSRVIHDEVAGTLLASALNVGAGILSRFSAAQLVPQVEDAARPFGAGVGGRVDVGAVQSFRGRFRRPAVIIKPAAEVWRRRKVRNEIWRAVGLREPRLFPVWAGHPETSLTLRSGLRSRLAQERARVSGCSDGRRRHGPEIVWRLGGCRWWVRSKDQIGVEMATGRGGHRLQAEQRLALISHLRLALAHEVRSRDLSGADGLRQTGKAAAGTSTSWPRVRLGIHQACQIVGKPRRLGFQSGRAPLRRLIRISALFGAPDGNRIKIRPHGRRRNRHQGAPFRQLRFSSRPEDVVRDLSFCLLVAADGRVQRVVDEHRQIQLVVVGNDLENKKAQLSSRRYVCLNFDVNQ